jgi:DNA invertase Pin-like site-specific DNA recombinase
VRLSALLVCVVEHAAWYQTVRPREYGQQLSSSGAAARFVESAGLISIRLTVTYLTMSVVRVVTEAIMAFGKWISYLRISTARQGKSGLGLEAQRSAVESYLNGGNWSLHREFVEVESGKRADRPKLAEAIKACRVYGAKLIIAKLDRLSRDAHFLLGLEKAGVDFVAADMPNANRLTVGIMAMVAEEERRMISARTKAAMAAAKRRGVELGGYRGVPPTAKARQKAREVQQARANEHAADLAETIKRLQAGGAESLRAIARGLNDEGIPTARGTGEWTATQVSRVLARLPG